MMKAAFVLTSVFALCLAAAPAEAQLARSFVSAAIGNDGNAPNCNRNTPCRSFQIAHDNTLDKGEITVLDPGSYGAVTVVKNISIINDGIGEAGILVSGGNTGISVNAPNASVSLRGLTIKGIGFGGGIGITFLAGAALNVENCTIRNLDGSGNGINFVPNGAAALQVTNTIVSDNTSAGIIVTQLGGTAGVVAVLDHVGLYNNTGEGLFVNGVNATSGIIKATVVESVASNNGAAFLAKSQQGAATASILLVRSVASGNVGSGVVSQGTNAEVLVDDSAIYGNLVNGWLALGGQVFSFGNNVLAHNGANEGPQSPLPLK